MAPRTDAPRSTSTSATGHAASEPTARAITTGAPSAAPSSAASLTSPIPIAPRRNSEGSSRKTAAPTRGDQRLDEALREEGELPREHARDARAARSGSAAGAPRGRSPRGRRARQHRRGEHAGRRGARRARARRRRARPPSARPAGRTRQARARRARMGTGQHRWAVDRAVAVLEPPWASPGPRRRCRRRRRCAGCRTRQRSIAAVLRSRRAPAPRRLASRAAGPRRRAAPVPRASGGGPRSARAADPA